MNAREIILANIHHDHPPRCGLDFDRGRISDFIFADLKPYHYQQKRWQEGEIEFYDDEWGNVWHRMIAGSFKGEIIHPAIATWEDMTKLRLPDYSHPACAEEMIHLFQQPTGKFKIVALGGWIFDNARYLRSLKDYFIDMGTNPEQLFSLHELIARVYEQKIHLAGKAGADGVFIAEDLGTQTGLLFSPRMFRLYFKELYARLFDIAHKYKMKVFMHSCGQNWAILPDLLDAGVDVFQFDQPGVYDMHRLADLLRERKCALYSPVDIQKILPSGDRGIIRQGAQELVDIFAGGLICKNYLDLPGIGVLEEWDDWAYQAICERVIEHYDAASIQAAT